MSLPTYQIDFNAIAAGKRVSSSKRKIRWRFGYANQQALDNGMTGTDCRGEEHDVTIVWSITSGKRQISMDGREIHYSTNRAGLLDFSWSTNGNHVVKVICHAAPPMSAVPEFRQYDLSIDGQSFFTMPKIFQVGIKGSVPNNIPGAYRGNHPISPVSMGSGQASNLSRDIPVSREQEEADLRQAIQASINDARKHLGELPEANVEGSNRNSYVSTSNGGIVAQEADLLGFGGPVGPPADSRSVASFYSAPTTYGQDYQSPPPPTTYPGQPPAPTAYPGQPPVRAGSVGALVPAVAPPGYYQAPPPSLASPAPFPPVFPNPPPPQQMYASPPPVPPAPAPTPNTYDVFNGGGGGGDDVFGLHGNAPVNHDPFVPRQPPPPTQEDLTSAILASYQTGPETPLAPPGAGHPVTPGAAAPPGAPHMNGNGNCVDSLSMGELAITIVQEPPKSQFEQALNNLVNIDHIDEPAEGEIKLTMIKKEEKAKKTPAGKSIPKPPAGVGMVGSNAPLSQIKQDFVPTNQNRTTEGVMNAPPPGAFHANAPNAGALVIHGQGPPPLGQMQGFGVGRMLPNGGFQHQQNLQPGQQFMGMHQQNTAQQYHQ